MKSVSRCIVALIFLAASAAAQDRTGQDAEVLRLATESARQALGTLAKLASGQNYRALGFGAADEARSATLGAPSRVVMVRLDELKEYAGGDAERLLHAVDRVTFPVEVGGQTRSSLTVTRVDGRWQAESFGAPQYARLLTEARARLAERAGVSAAEVFEAQVPSLNVRFVGARAASGLLLAAVADDARFGFKRGDAVPAAEALGKLVAAAREHNGLPN